MSSYTDMPDNVSMSWVDRAMIEGKVFRSLYTKTVPGDSTVWLYIKMSTEKATILFDRFLGASSGPIIYEVYDQVTLTGALGDSVVVSNANRALSIQSLAEINEVDASSISVTSSLSDEDVVFASESTGNRSVGSGNSDAGVSVYPAGSTAAVKIQNTSSNSALIFLKYIWVEENE